MNHFELKKWHAAGLQNVCACLSTVRCRFVPVGTAGFKHAARVLSFAWPRRRASKLGAAGAYLEPRLGHPRFPTTRRCWKMLGLDHRGASWNEGRRASPAKRPGRVARASPIRRESSRAVRRVVELGEGGLAGKFCPNTFPS